MKLPCFRLRSLMMTVAGLAVVVGLGLRSARLRELAKYHHDRKLHYSVLALILGRCGSFDGLDELCTIELTPEGASVRPASPEAEQILKLRARERAVQKRALEDLAAYHARCAHRVERAASRPWLSVSIDPPPPEPH
ncbi:MAG: hypothetical protein ACHRXM_12985 [Isosphaerales bacterium]